jgi:SAM-dependent methyltransferase
VDAYLDQHAGIRTKEKESKGEVFTPVSVIDDMLALLPSPVWKNKDLKWLDPACGIGQFPLKILVGGKGYPGLLKGLEEAIPEKRKRLNHILGTMLTCVDINPENTATLQRYLQDSHSQIRTGDALSMTFPHQYDIIVGNPPYNQGGVKRVGEKRIHVRFVERALRLLGPRGLLLFVCPPSYREAGSTMNRLFLDGSKGSSKGSSGFREIVMYDPDQTHKLFGIQARVDAFLYDPHYTGKTHIVDSKGYESTIQLDLTHHVPNYGHTIFEKMRKHGFLSIHGTRSAEATTVHCDNFSPQGKYPILHLLVEGGRKILRRTRKHKDQRIPKLLLNGLGVPYVFYDKEGRYGVTQVPVVIPNPSKELVAFTKTPLFYYILGALKLTGNNNLPYMLSAIPKGYGREIVFTKEEREQIERTRVPICEDKEIRVPCE